MKRMYLSTALGLSAMLLSPLASAEQKLIPAQSEIQFVSKQMGVPVEGKFKKFDAQISFDPAKPETFRIAFTIDTGSASFGAPQTDAELPKAPWFNVAKFPQATFESTGIKGAAGKFEVTGKLTIKGNVKDVTVPVVLTQAANVTTAAGSFSIKRLNFKIGDGEWTDTSMVADDVQVKFKLALSGVGKI